MGTSDNTKAYNDRAKPRETAGTTPYLPFFLVIRYAAKPGRKLAVNVNINITVVLREKQSQTIGMLKFIDCQIATRRNTSKKARRPAITAEIRT
jgi:hypothetical protein